MRKVGRDTALLVVDKLRGKGRPRHNAWGTYTDPDDRLYEASIREQYMAQVGDARRAFTGPVSLEIEFSRPLPKSYAKKMNGSADTATPDIDNMGKSVLDALNGIAYADDKQVFELHMKRLPRFHGTESIIRIEANYWEEEWM